MPETRRLPKALALVLPAALCAAALYAMTYQQRQKPYFEQPVSKQIRTLSDIAERYGPITTNQSTARHIRELVELIERHALSPGRDFVVLDEFPLIHYVMDRQNPALMDWYLGYEMPGLNRSITRQLAELDAVLILQRRPGVSVLGITRARKHDCRATDFNHSPFRNKILFEKGRLLESTPLFCVVEMPRARHSRGRPPRG